MGSLSQHPAIRYLESGRREEPDVSRLRAGGHHARPTHPNIWANYENWSPCFQVDVVGTTGSGDATIAGFLAALLRDLPPDKTITAALAVGACNVESADALSGIRSWEETWRRIDSGWARYPNDEKNP